MTFPQLGNFDLVAVSASVDFPSNSKGDAPFHCIAYHYSCTEWDGFKIIWEMYHWRVSLNLVLLQLLMNFVSGFRLELMHTFLIINIRSSFVYLHDFQLLVLLPWLTEITFFICTNRINILNPMKSSDRVVMVAKGFFKLPKLYMLIKKRVYHFLETWLLQFSANS